MKNFLKNYLINIILGTILLICLFKWMINPLFWVAEGIFIALICLSESIG